MSAADGSAEVPVRVEEQSTGGISQSSENNQSRFSRAREALGRFLPRRREEQSAEEQQSLIEQPKIPELELTQSQTQVAQEDEEQLEEVREKIAEIKIPSEPAVKEALPSSEPMSMATIDEIRKLLVSLPQETYDDNRYFIPWRNFAGAEKKMPVLDEETGLMLQVSYEDNPDNSNALSVVQITLSTPKLTVRELSDLSEEEKVEWRRGGFMGFSGKSADDAEQMAIFLRKIYGDSPELEEQIKRNYESIGEQRGQIKWGLYSYTQDEGIIRSNFAALSEEDSVDLRLTGRSKGDISEAGGQFLKSILERAVSKQVAEAEENARQCKEIAERSNPIPNDPEKVNEYAYHATPRSNLPDIAESGLMPSGSNSKEPGTIFFNPWDSATQYLPEGESGVLFRFHISDIPEIATAWNDNLIEGLLPDNSAPSVSKLPIPREKLDFSLDGGETWRNIVPPEVASKAA